jgi:hypothetical protein
LGADRGANSPVQSNYKNNWHPVHWSLAVGAWNAGANYHGTHET